MRCAAERERRGSKRQRKEKKRAAENRLGEEKEVEMDRQSPVQARIKSFEDSHKLEPAKKIKSL